MWGLTTSVEHDSIQFLNSVIMVFSPILAVVIYAGQTEIAKRISSTIGAVSGFEHITTVQVRLLFRLSITS